MTLTPKMARTPLAASHIDPFVTTEHGLRSKLFEFSGGGEPEGLGKNPCGIGENQHTTLLTYGLSRESVQGHSGWATMVGSRQAIHAQS